MKFFIVFYFVAFLLMHTHCNSNSQNMKNENNKILQLVIKSPSGRCNYDIKFVNNHIKIHHTEEAMTDSNDVKTNLNITLSDDNIKYLKRIVTKLKDSNPFVGELWKDGWNYTVFYDGVEKINVYEANESDLIKDLLKIVESQSSVQINYTCF